jgi:ADP-ribose pyrophosphatase
MARLHTVVAASVAEEASGLIETCTSSEILQVGKFLTWKRDWVRLPDGKSASREYVEHPGAVMIMPLFDDGRVLLERQYRYPVAQVMIEFPAGKLDPKEGAPSCAARELREETGYSASEMTFVTRIHPVISYSTEVIDIYLARGLAEGQCQLDEGEFIETFAVEVGTLLDWVRLGKVSDVKTIIGAFWLEKILSGNWQPGAAPSDV